MPCQKMTTKFIKMRAYSSERFFFSSGLQNRKRGLVILKTSRELIAQTICTDYDSIINFFPPRLIIPRKKLKQYGVAVFGATKASDLISEIVCIFLSILRTVGIRHFEQLGSRQKYFYSAHTVRADVLNYLLFVEPSYVLGSFYAINIGLGSTGIDLDIIWN